MIECEIRYVKYMLYWCNFTQHQAVGKVDTINMFKQTTCLADGVIPIWTMIIARVILSSCILVQYLRQIKQTQQIVKIISRENKFVVLDWTKCGSFTFQLQVQNLSGTGTHHTPRNPRIEDILLVQCVFNISGYLARHKTHIYITNI